MPKDIQPAVLTQIQSLIQKNRGKVTIAELTTATGLPIEKIRAALYTLLERYECNLQMDPETGKLLFQFRYPLKPRSARSFKEILYDIATFLWKVFVKVYKAAIGVILIVYTVIFAILLLFLSSAGGSRDRRQGMAINPAILFRILFELAGWTHYTRQIYWEQDAAGFKYPTYRPKKEKKKFLNAVYDFVFGPEYPNYHPYDDPKEVATFIHYNEGYLTPGHLVALSGRAFAQAEQDFTKYLARFEGDADITEDGTVVAYFPKLIDPSQKKPDPSTIILYPDEVDPPVVHNGNTAGQNFAVIAMNTFNLLMSLVIIQNATQIASNLELSTSPSFLLFLGYFPLVVSVLYFLIPLARIPYTLYKKKQRARNIVRKKIFRVILAFGNTPLPEKKFYNYANLEIDERPIAKDILRQMVRDYEGELHLDEEGTPTYSFPRLWRELQIGPWFTRRIPQ